MSPFGWLPVLALIGTTAHALPPMPAESGWSGYVNLGASAMSAKNNMVNGIASFDLGKARVSSLDQSADNEEVVIPAVYFELVYTLADMRTQFYVANQTEDYLSFELETTLETQGGVRQQIAGVGTFDLALVASSLATKVWKDPYVVDAPRGDTERTTSGVYFAWDTIFEQPVEFQLRVKEIELDDEESGRSPELGLSPDQLRLLRRTGNVMRLNLNYRWQINERNQLVPGVTYLDFDLDGDAMAEDGFGLQLKHAYDADSWQLVSRVYYQRLEADTDNPIYGKQREVDALGGSITGLYPGAFGLKNWTANATVAIFDGNSNINFYDTSLWMASVGMLYRFE
jgi:hypothetical protein